MVILKRQLEEKEKLLATEQEDAAVAKSKLRELNKVQPAVRPVLSSPGLWPALPLPRTVSLPAARSSLGPAEWDLPSNQGALRLCEACRQHVLPRRALWGGGSVLRTSRAGPRALGV